MKHIKKGRKFHRKKGQREALLKSLGENLILRESIITTNEKAKELRGFLEKKITFAKKGGVLALRELQKYFSKKASQKLVKEISQTLMDRKGGYTRIIKIGPRAKDNVKMVKIEILK